MNKEYEDLLSYIATLERTQQQDLFKLTEEMARHEHTKKMLQESQVNIERLQQTLEAMQSTVKGLRKECEEESKTGEQYTETLRHLKDELRHLQARQEQAVAETAKRREYYTITLAKARERCSLLKAHSQVNREASDSGMDLDDITEIEGNVEELENTVRQLEEQLRTEMEAELLAQRAVMAKQKDMLEQQKQLQESAIKQLRHLDQYGNKLSKTFDTFQQYCNELEASVACTCPESEEPEKEDPAQAGGDPAM